MKLHRNLTLLALLAGMSGVLSAAEVQGVLMDHMCSMKAAKEGQKMAAMHTRECALMPSCAQSGYGVFTSDNKFLAFDAAGNQQAAAALKGTTKKDNLRVTVTGDVQGDTLNVTSLKLQ